MLLRSKVWRSVNRTFRLTVALASWGVHNFGLHPERATTEEDVKELPYFGEFFVIVVCSRSGFFIPPVMDQLLPKNGCGMLE